MYTIEEGQEGDQEMQEMGLQNLCIALTKQINNENDNEFKNI